MTSSRNNDTKTQPSSYPLTASQANTTTPLSYNPYQAAGNIKFKQEPKNFKLEKILKENVETSVTGVGAAQTSSHLKSNGNFTNKVIH
jgi:hypothetical protein